MSSGIFLASMGWWLDEVWTIKLEYDIEEFYNIGSVI